MDDLDSGHQLGGGEAAKDTQLSAERGTRYSLCENPPLLLTALLGFQHCLTMLGAAVLVPMLAVPAMGGDKLDTAHVICTILLVSGLNTLIQTSIGSRLPIVQGSSLAFVGPTFAIIFNEEFQGIEDPKERFQRTMQTIQGGVIVCGCAQVLLGYSGFLARALRLLSPLTILPTLTAVILSLYPIGLHGLSKCWEIGLPQIALVILFSQFCDRVTIPVRGLGPLPVFKVSPVLLALAVVWMWAFLLTKTFVYGSSSPCRTDLSTVIFDARWLRCPYPFQWGWPRFEPYAISAMFSATLVSMVQSVGDYYACARECGAPVPTGAILSRGLGAGGLNLVFCGALGTVGGTASYGESVTAIAATRVGSRTVVQMSALIMLVAAPIGKLGAVFASMPEPMVSALLLSVVGLASSAALSNLRHTDMGSRRNLFIFIFALFCSMNLSGPGGYFATYGDQAVQTTLNTIGAPRPTCRPGGAPSLQPDANSSSDDISAPPPSAADALGSNASDTTSTTSTAPPSLNNASLASLPAANPFGEGRWATMGQAFFLNNPMIVAFLCAIVLDNLAPGTREERGLQAWEQAKGKNVFNDEDYARAYLLPLRLGRCVRDYAYLDWIDSGRKPQQSITKMRSKGDLHELLCPCCPCSKQNAGSPEIVEYRV